MVFPFMAPQVTEKSAVRRSSLSRLVPLLAAALFACSGNDFEPAVAGDAAPAIDSNPAMPEIAAPADAMPDAAEVPRADTSAEADPTEADPADVAADTSEASFDAATERALQDRQPDATCDALTTFYRDRDGDGFGVTAEHVAACVAPRADDAGAWVAEPGDCRDDLPAVKPFKAGGDDPPKYSGVGYTDPSRPQGISFDYDCNGVETADPSNMFGAAPTCPALATNCNGIGYVPASPARSGPGIDPLCGSTTLMRCTVQGLNCNPQPIYMSTPFRCR
jgi:hypothetical protein